MVMSTTSLPTLYQHYTGEGINFGLSVDQPYFTLNNKNISIYSGAMHYFRVPQPYWRDRLRKIRASGLNTVETYIPWNLHEPEIGRFDFGKGDSDMSNFLDLKDYLKTAQEEDLFVIARPGPFICAEFEFGGLPSWLLREKGIKIRTSDSKFMKHVARYFNTLILMLATLQFTSGGPIIAFQIENEYGSTQWKTDNGSFTPDKEYLKQLRDLFIQNGIRELLFTSDKPSWKKDYGSLPDLFQTANFDEDPKLEFDTLKSLQNNKPFMAMEFWVGWFDHWGDRHSQKNNSYIERVLEEILIYPGSVNIYMFHGGTNWGFLNGANIESNLYKPDTTSYDYDAPVSESGDYTQKYYVIKNLLEKYNTITTKLPDAPTPSVKLAYPKIIVEKTLPYKDITSELRYAIQSENMLPMELLPINNMAGQSYGYIIYRKNLDIPQESVLTIKGFVHDSVLVLIDDKLISPPLSTAEDLNKFGYWRMKDSTILLPKKSNATLDIIVANWGRNNYGPLEQFQQYKGISDDILLNGEKLTKWTIFPVEFKQNWTKSLSGWQPFHKTNVSFHSANLIIEGPAFDTFIDMSEWNTGIVIVNNFVLGRYMHIGPQQTLYLPAPFLKNRINKLIVFEHFSPATHLSFSKNHKYLNK